jgi:hypothetical protein
MSAAPDKNRTRTRHRVERFALSARITLGNVYSNESPQAFEAWQAYLQVKEEKASEIDEYHEGWSKVGQR